MEKSRECRNNRLSRAVRVPGVHPTPASGLPDSPAKFYWQNFEPVSNFKTSNSLHTHFPSLLRSFSLVSSSSSFPPILSVLDLGLGLVSSLFSMENPTLRLVVDKGPKEGETLECKSGALTRIGRVVKGNTFAIRDPGISQKHLAFEFLSDTSRWAVYDLDTSNGTLVNDAKVAPSVPFLLSDGDSIKIGEMTSIFVRISGERPHIEAAAALEEKEEGRTWVRRRGLRRGAPPARSVAEPPSDAVVEEGSEAPARYGGRGRGRSKKAAASARVSMKDEILDAVVGEESAEVSKNAGRGRGRGRRPTTRASSARVSKEEKPLGSVPVSYAEAAEAAEKGGLRVEANNAGDGVKLAERVAGEVGQEKGEDDMDKMTLEEWFDRMEKLLPMMINDISEEIISSLREKAQRFDEFIAQSTNAS